MNKKVLIILFLILNIEAFTQEIKGKIINSSTKEPLPLATIITKFDKLSGSYANENGEFTITPKTENDSLFVSCIGYLSKEVCIKEYLNEYNSVIELTPIIHQLPNILVKNANSIPKEIGYCDLNKSFIQAGTKGGIIIVRIPNDIDTIYHKIISLNFIFGSISHPDQKHNKGIIRIRLYDCDSNNYEPSHNLLPEDIILTIPESFLPWKKNVLKVDISKYNIQFPTNGIYLGIEWIGETENNLLYNINPGIWYSRDVINFSSRVSFFGREFKDLYNKKEKHIPMFGITIK